jgi:lysophospholipase L1-like esterase
MKIAAFALLSSFVLAGVTQAKEPPLIPVPLHMGGRFEVSENSSSALTHQWPGVYTEAKFSGGEIFVRVNDTHNKYKVYIDGALHDTWVRPGKQLIHIWLKDKSPHLIRVEKITESQDHTSSLDRIFVTRLEHGLPAPAPRARQIEFIGDSFTVGYGNTSPKRECTIDEVWATTDTSQAFGPLTAKAYNADYQINAFSGRGVVRNYDGFAGDTLPVLHNYTLFDGKTEYKATNWQPQIIVIGLGTNDFSTALKPTEAWKTREDLRADYRNTYVKFVKTLRAKNPKAQFILMASDQSDGEIRDQVLQVEKALEAQGETQVDTIIFTGLDYAGCHAHPSVADDLKLKGLLMDYIHARPALWQGR